MWVISEIQLYWRYLLVASARYPVVVEKVSTFSVCSNSQKFTKERIVGELTAKVSAKARA